MLKRRYPRWMARPLMGRPLRLMRRRKRALAGVADPAVVSEAVVAADAIAGSFLHSPMDILSEPPHLPVGRRLLIKPEVLFNEITDCLSGR
jgi:hypothetical protein